MMTIAVLAITVSLAGWNRMCPKAWRRKNLQGAGDPVAEFGGGSTHLTGDKPLDFLLAARMMD